MILAPKKTMHRQTGAPHKLVMWNTELDKANCSVLRPPKIRAAAAEGAVMLESFSLAEPFFLVPMKEGTASTLSAFAPYMSRGGQKAPLLGDRPCLAHIALSKKTLRWGNELAFQNRLAEPSHPQPSRDTKEVPRHRHPDTEPSFRAYEPRTLSGRTQGSLDRNHGEYAHEGRSGNRHASYSTEATSGLPTDRVLKPTIPYHPPSLTQEEADTTRGESHREGVSHPGDVSHSEDVSHSGSESHSGDSLHAEKTRAKEVSNAAPVNKAAAPRWPVADFVVGVWDGMMH
ncbi:hypothetical protein CYLTODRAFT_458911 [Cylindrobasidium torrendii FP15055 ss-10]|uniref:Uncharacterized protein n=1 Tax=Cylindrobasidium torrendii FP15055 ss-10 TaxID=1314674 RepID=A0A0D7AXC8_9AGAR|nr:hypothetical protein CYLTODRAFT_458911 [Cylindrobasidium torrendii FP15055 ss-10]